MLASLDFWIRALKRGSHPRALVNRARRTRSALSLGEAYDASDVRSSRTASARAVLRVDWVSEPRRSYRQVRRLPTPLLAAITQEILEWHVAPYLVALDCRALECASKQLRLFLVEVIPGLVPCLFAHQKESLPGVCNTFCVSALETRTRTAEVS